MDKAELLRQYASVFKTGGCEISEEDYREFETKKSLLLQLAQMENSSMTVFDMHKRAYSFVHSKFDNRLYYPFNDCFKKDPGYFFSLMPYPDMKFLIDTVQKTFSFLHEQDNTRLKEYKLVFEFRLSDPAGNLFRFLQQCMVLEQDKSGQMWMILILNDFMPDRPTYTQLLRRVIHMPSGKICLFHDDTIHTKDKFLSKRETEILGLLSQGLQSKEISDRLFISINTVNNHRQKIIEKLNSENTHEALRFAKIIGIV